MTVNKLSNDVVKLAYILQTLIINIQRKTFLAELNKMFSEKRLKGSIQLVIKKYDGREAAIPKPQRHSKEAICLIRAHTNQRKISTIVTQNDFVRFHIAYITLLRKNFDGLKKQKKVKSSKVA